MHNARFFISIFAVAFACASLLACTNAPQKSADTVVQKSSDSASKRSQIATGSSAEKQILTWYELLPDRFASGALNEIFSALSPTFVRLEFDNSGNGQRARLTRQQFIEFWKSEPTKRGIYGNGPSVVWITNITSGSDRATVKGYIAGSWRAFPNNPDPRYAEAGMSFSNYFTDSWIKTERGWQLNLSEYSKSLDERNLSPTHEQMRATHNELLMKHGIAVAESNTANATSVNTQKSENWAIQLFGSSIEKVEGILGKPTVKDSFYSSNQYSEATYSKTGFGKIETGFDKKKLIVLEIEFLKSPADWIQALAQLGFDSKDVSSRRTPADNGFDLTGVPGVPKGWSVTYFESTPISDSFPNGLPAKLSFYSPDAT